MQMFGHLLADPAATLRGSQTLGAQSSQAMMFCDVDRNVVTGCLQAYLQDDSNTKIAHKILNRYAC